jgi:hypothetical protein
MIANILIVVAALAVGVFWNQTIDAWLRSRGC